MKHHVWISIKDQETEPKCLCCGTNHSITLVSSRTYYEPEVRTRFERILGLKEEDPNAPIPLCPKCSKEHELQMDYQWHEYYSGIL